MPGRGKLGHYLLRCRRVYMCAREGHVAAALFRCPKATVDPQFWQQHAYAAATAAALENTHSTSHSQLLMPKPGKVQSSIRASRPVSIKGSIAGCLSLQRPLPPAAFMSLHLPTQMNPWPASAAARCGTWEETAHSLFWGLKCTMPCPTHLCTPHRPSRWEHHWLQARDRRLQRSGWECRWGQDPAAGRQHWQARCLRRRHTRCPCMPRTQTASHGIRGRRGEGWITVWNR